MGRWPHWGDFFSGQTGRRIGKGIPMALLLSPLVRVNRFFSPRLEQVSPYIKGNLLAEARSLNRAGYSSAAVAMARMAVERRLLELIRANPKLTNPRRNFGVGTGTSMLVAVKVIAHCDTKLIDTFGAKANKIVHGAATTRMQARKLIIQAAAVLAMLDRKGGAA
jgi:hypothetical protein